MGLAPGSFIGMSVMSIALVAAALGRFWNPFDLGSWVFVPISLLMTVVDRMQSKHQEKKAAQNATGMFIALLAIEAMCVFADADPHENWLRLIALNLMALTAYGFLRWMMTLSVAASAKALPFERAVWLPRYGVVWRTPKDLELKIPMAARLIVAVFPLMMWGFVGVAFVLAFDPSVFPGPQPHGIFWRILPAACGLGLSAFAFGFSGLCGPRDLRLELDTRTYSHRYWAPMPGSSLDSYSIIPFCLICHVGVMDDDFRGVGLRQWQNKGGGGHRLQLVWRDAARPPQVLKNFDGPDEARTAMMVASEELGLPALGRVA